MLRHILLLGVSSAAPLTFEHLGSTWTMEAKDGKLHVTADCAEDAWCGMGFNKATPTMDGATLSVLESCFSMGCRSEPSKVLMFLRLASTLEWIYPTVRAAVAQPPVVVAVAQLHVAAAVAQLPVAVAQLRVEAAAIIQKAAAVVAGFRVGPCVGPTPTCRA